MSKPVKIAIVVAAALLIGFTLYIVNKPKEVFETEGWHKSFSPSDKGPYGTFVFKELLDTNGIFGDFVKINSALEENLVDNEDENDIYLFIGDDYYIDRSDFDILKNFVSDGNTALISSYNLPDFILDFVFIKLNSVYKTVYDTTIQLIFDHEKLTDSLYQFNYIYNNKPEFFDWHVFNDSNFQYHDDDVKVLGRNQNQGINFIEVPYGDGSFFIHSIPYVFTNISMFQNDGFTYAEKVIAHLPYGIVQWDAYNLRSHFSSNNESKKNNRSTSKSRSLFEFLFKHQSLTWAFFTLLFTALLYLIFKGRRKQKVIGPVESKENSSLRYLETVSSLYLQERKHDKLIRLQKKSFIDFIANHYFISSHKIDDKYITKLTEKSGISKETIVNIFTELETLSNQELVSDAELIELQQKIEYFYKKCK